jgi:hypothetical protein
MHIQGYIKLKKYIRNIIMHTLKKIPIPKLKYVFKPGEILLG